MGVLRESVLLAFVQLQSAATAANAGSSDTAESARAHPTSHLAGPQASLVSGLNAPAAPKTKHKLGLLQEHAARLGRRPLEMENSLILRAVKYVALPQWSPKPAGVENVCGVVGTARARNVPSRSRHRACWTRAFQRL